ncbi:alpha/beta hydrolase [Streptomyces sp. NBC_00237]|uniref:alpha/beta fold hydrolase n=1 Tax=Streptomyces sp. NBC_00237 TaxID=2975687 RepID=UPI002255001B|nr:alpha/beta hydrolase [Streptomyces sp. NBC_00237]MCX5206509.1 alpha/beta hydrolase [Streptomyces sp. NBC_00237]
MEPNDSALPLVFLHGVRVSGTMWHPVMEAVDAGSGHRRMVAPDLPGHGRRRGERFTIDAAVDAVAEAIDELGGRALLVGLSAGGYVSIATAARHPGRVAGVLALGCTGVPRGVYASVFRQQFHLGARYPEVAEWLSVRGFRRTLSARAAEAMTAGGLSCEVMGDVADAITGLDPLGLLAQYPGPVWLVNGARDPFRGDERAFLAACRDGRLAVWPGLGHLTTLSDPRALARTVLDVTAAVEHQRCAAV